MERKKEKEKKIIEEREREQKTSEIKD